MDDKCHYYKEEYNLEIISFNHYKYQAQFILEGKNLWGLCYGNHFITKINDHTSGKSLKSDIEWEVHKRTQQGVSAKLEFYIY